MIECVRRTTRNVKHWQSGDMALRWTAAGMLEAEQQFRRIIGYRDLAKLAIAIERHLTAQGLLLFRAREVQRYLREPGLAQGQQDEEARLRRLTSEEGAQAPDGSSPACSTQSAGARPGATAWSSRPSCSS